MQISLHLAMRQAILESLRMKLTGFKAESSLRLAMMYGSMHAWVCSQWLISWWYPESMEEKIVLASSHTCSRGPSLSCTLQAA